MGHCTFEKNFFFREKITAVFCLDLSKVSWAQPMIRFYSHAPRLKEKHSEKHPHNKNFVLTQIFDDKTQAS